MRVGENGRVARIAVASTLAGTPLPHSVAKLDVFIKL